MKVSLSLEKYLLRRCADMKNKDRDASVVIVVLDTGVSEQFSDILFDSYELTKRKTEHIE